MSDPAMNELLQARISRTALRHNFQLLQAYAGTVPLCAMVKANAYGHSIPCILQALQGLPKAFWGVASLSEAVELRDLGVKEPILLARPFGDYESSHALTETLDILSRLEIRTTLVNREGLDCLMRHRAPDAPRLPVHIKMDSGMGRNGCPAEETLALLQAAMAAPTLSVEGFYSHFAAADDSDLTSARAQLETFESVARELRSRGLAVPFLHMANSGAIFNLPASHYGLVRPGIALYGYAHPDVKGSEQLQPTLTLDAPVLMTKRIRKGMRCGYGGTFQATRDSLIALLPIGYADGYSRQWSNQGQVDFSGRRAPVIGRISMDLTIIDVTDVPGIQAGCRARLISPHRNDPHSVESMARQLGTIPYEIVTLLGRRVQRLLTD